MKIEAVIRMLSLVMLLAAVHSVTEPVSASGTGLSGDDALPYWEEWTVLEAAYKEAPVLGEAYPANPNEAVRVEIEGTHAATTAFGAAILQGNRQQIAAYITAGADIKAPIWVKNDNGEYPDRAYPTFLAVGTVVLGKADAGLVGYLCECGADINARTTIYGKSNDGKTAVSSTLSTLINAVFSTQVQIVDAVLRQKPGDLSFGHETAKGSNSPLFMAVVRNLDDIVNLLLENGAEPSIGFTSKVAEHKAKSPLKMAQELPQRQKEPSGREKAERIIALLREHGAQE